MNFINEYFWLVGIVVMFLNGFHLKHRSKEYIQKNPELEDGYNKIFKGWIIYGNIPWIIMGIGIFTKSTQSIFDYFTPRAMNPMVLIFHFSIVAIWLIGNYWIFCQKGAEFLATHPGLIQIRGFGKTKDITDKNIIKLIWIIAMLGGITGMSMMWLDYF